MKDRLTIKYNQRHKFSNFGEPCTLNSYCQKPRCHTNTRFLLKNAGNNFWFDLCYHEAVLCTIFSQFQKNEGTIFRIFSTNRKFLSPILPYNTETRNDCAFSDKYVCLNHILKATACSESIKNFILKNQVEKICRKI